MQKYKCKYVYIYYYVYVYIIYIYIYYQTFYFVYFGPWKSAESESFLSRGRPPRVAAI